MGHASYAPHGCFLRSADIEDHFRDSQRKVFLASLRKPAFLRHLYIKRSFYQDRLGTNIGKALKKDVPFFAPVPPSY
jgi:hypothetical protein